MRNKYRIEWLEPAKQDLRAIIFYLFEKAPLVALGVQEEFAHQLAILADFPYLGMKMLTSQVFMILKSGKAFDI